MSEVWCVLVLEVLRISQWLQLVPPWLLISAKSSDFLLQGGLDVWLKMAKINGVTRWSFEERCCVKLLNILVVSKGNLISVLVAIA